MWACGRGQAHAHDHYISRRLRQTRNVIICRAYWRCSCLRRIALRSFTAAVKLIGPGYVLISKFSTVLFFVNSYCRKTVGRSVSGIASCAVDASSAARWRMWRRHVVRLMIAAACCAVHHAKTRPQHLQRSEASVLVHCSHGHGYSKFSGQSRYFYTSVYTQQACFNRPL